VGSDLALLISLRPHVCLLPSSTRRHTTRPRPAKWGLLELAVTVICNSETYGIVLLLGTRDLFCSRSYLLLNNASMAQSEGRLQLKSSPHGDRNTRWSVKPHFPASLAAGIDHMTEAWPVGCEQNMGPQTWHQPFGP
jgi:hypothetical protein